MKRTLTYCILISLVLFTPFIYSDNLYNGLIFAKQIWFYGAMALLILAFGIDLLFCRNKVSFSLNIIDIALLVFYTYFFIRAVFTPYTSLFYNNKFLNISLLVLMFFVIKELIILLESHSVVIRWSFGSHSIVSQPNDVRSTNDNRMTPEGQMTSNSKFISIIILLLILTGLIQAIWGLLQLYGMTRSFHSGFKITGTFFNPAPYALYLAVVFPLALGTLLEIKELSNERIKELNNLGRPQSYSHISQFLHSLTPSFLISKISYYISLLTVIAIIIVLPATMNRASWLGIAASSIFIFNYKYNFINRAKSYLHNAVRKLCALAIVILLIGFMGGKIGHIDHPSPFL